MGRKWHADDICGRGRHARFIDANGDKFPDLFLANSKPRPVPDECDTSTQLPNENSKLFINQGGKSFHYAPGRMDLTPGMGERCVEPLDYNGDGWQRPSSVSRLEPATRSLSQQRRARLHENVSAHHQLADPIADAAVVDFDHDGDPDLVTARALGYFYQLNENHSFGASVQIGSVVDGADGWAVAVADIDGDGDRDVYGMIGDSTLASNPRDTIWLRQGTTFTPYRVPLQGGLADDIVVVHPWSGGRAGLLVLNGYDKCCGANAHALGPIALLRWHGG